MKTRILLGLVIFAILTVDPVSFLGARPQISKEEIPTGCALIEGRVLDEKSRPVTGAKVHAFAPTYPIKGRLRAAPEAITDQQGNFILRCVKPGRNLVGVGKESEGYPDTLLTPFIDGRLIKVVSIPEQQSASGVIVRLGPKSGRLTGRIIDAVTQHPIEGAQLLICRSQQDRECRAIDPNAQGAGQFSFLTPPIPITIKASAPGFEEWRSHLAPLKANSEKIITITLRPRR